MYTANAIRTKNSSVRGSDIWVRTRKNSPRVELYGLHGLPLTYFWHRTGKWLVADICQNTDQVFREPEPQNRKHPLQRIIRIPNAAASKSISDRHQMVGLL